MCGAEPSKICLWKSKKIKQPQKMSNNRSSALVFFIFSIVYFAVYIIPNPSFV